MSDPDEHAVRLRDIEITYAGTSKPALSVQALTIAPGERVALVGRSGAGKTTLLRLLNGQLRDFRGEAEVLGHRLGRRPPPRALRRRIGFIFQEFALIEEASVRDNVLMGRLGYVSPWLSLPGLFPAADRALCDTAIEQAGLAGLADQRAGRLSGGQKQRAGVARAIVQSPELLLADEPVSNLDPAYADEILALIVRLAATHHSTVVMSLHQPALARRYADRIVALSHGQVTFDGPASRFTEGVEHGTYRGLSQVPAS